MLSIVGRTTLKPDSSHDRHWPAAAVTRIVLTSKTGAVDETTTLYAPGHHKSRVSAEQLTSKFMRLSSRVLGQSQQREFIAASGSLEQLRSVGELTRPLRCSSAI